MWMRIQAFALGVAMLAVASGTALSAESPSKRDPSGLPKGSFVDSCTCQMSGGVTLICYCSNLQARMFQTTLDVRSCPAPKDIKNCDGRLTCTDGVNFACPQSPAK
jgi:hypothetical protein